MTLIEFIVTIVVLSIGLTGILSVMMTLTKNSVDPELQWQAMMIGDMAMHEMLNKKNNLQEDGCVNKRSSNEMLNLCDYQGIKNMPVKKLFPELSRNFTTDAFDVSIEIKRAEKSKDSALIWIGVTHQHLGQVTFSAIKAKGNDRHAKDARVYTY